MSQTFDSEFCNVTYMETDNVVLLTWKKFCCFDDYRKPTLFASQMLKENEGSNLVIDARNGFEDEKEDVDWGFTVLLPDMSKSSCQNCIFILDQIPAIEDEIDLWTTEFKKYFNVHKVQSYDEAVIVLSTKYPLLDECLQKQPATVKEFQPAWQAYKYLLRGKMYAYIGIDDHNRRPIVTLKLDPTFSDILRCKYEDIVPGYYMNKLHWSTVYLDGDVPQDVLADIVCASYQWIRSSLSKKVQKELEEEN